MKTLKSPGIYRLSLVACVLLILAIIYFVLTGLKPCPMCILQQVGLVVLTIISLIAVIHKPQTTGVRVYSFLLGLISLIVALVALKQVYMQLHPDVYVGSCRAGVDTLFYNLPFLEFAKSLVTSLPDCSEVNWRVFGFTMAEYSFVFFIVFSVVHFWQFLFFNDKR